MSAQHICGQIITAGLVVTVVDSLHDLNATVGFGHMTEACYTLGMTQHIHGA